MQFDPDLARRILLEVEASPPNQHIKDIEFPDVDATATAIQRRTIGEWFEQAEAKAGVTKQDGRGPYGVRRTFVDAGKALRISREGLTALGGWADPQMADRIYAEEEQRYAQREARDVRARIRGEPLRESGENGDNYQQTSNSRSQAEAAVGQGVR